jgi:Ser/Thr protein kinase RdoA (MazF antagonist)
MRVVHSLPHPDDLAELITREYDIAGPVTVSLLRRGFNDTYLVTDAAGDRQVLRVYARGKYWIRSETDLLFEMELLDQLATAGRSVSHPYPRRRGDLLGSLLAPEGERHYALLSFAAGPSLSERPAPIERLAALGSEIAWMHAAMDRFRSDHSRYHLDLSILLDMPLAAVEPYVSEGGKARYIELCELAERLRSYVSALELSPEAYGLIHADLHDGNINVAPTGDLVFFDFDHCGFGWRGYELATFYRGADAPESERANWSALLEGYERVRPLDAGERAALPVFAACRGFWNIGDWTLAVDRNGHAGVDDRVCDRILDDARRPLEGLDW